ncbi:MAG: alpha/beta hydrolase [Treponema sp.]|nr:alpha/beta hydrolase [Treponema sp.]
MALIPVVLASILLAVLLLVFFILPRYFYRIVVARRPPSDREPNWLSTQTLEDLWIQGPDGLRLHAYYLAAEPGGDFSATAVLAHGYNGDGRQLDVFARLFHRLGLNVLLLEARGYGLSEGRYTGFGWHERLDMLGWMALLKERGEKRIVLYGISMGASTVLMTAGEDVPPELKLIIADCGYTSALDELNWQLKRGYHISFPPLIRALSRLTEKRAGYRLEEASALEQVKKSRTPVLFIHGEADTFVPFEMCSRLYAACVSEKELYTVPGAEHGLAYDTDKEEYGRRIALFMKKYLRGTETKTEIQTETEAKTEAKTETKTKTEAETKTAKQPDFPEIPLPKRAE